MSTVTNIASTSGWEPTTTGSCSLTNYCSSCQTYYYGFNHVCNYVHWLPAPMPVKDEVAELRAWLDGYTQDRALTKKQLAYIRKKLRKFADA